MSGDAHDLHRFLRDETRSTLFRLNETRACDGVSVAIWEQGDDSFTAPAMDSHFLALCLSGAARADITFDAVMGETRCLVLPRSICFMPRGNSARLDLVGRYTALHVVLPHAVLQDIIVARHGDDRLADGLHGFTAQRDTELSRLLLLLLHGLLEHRGRLAIGDVAMRLADRLSILALPPGHLSTSPVSLSGVQLRAAMGFIEDHLHEDIGVDDVARTCRLTPTQFAAAFQAETGQTLSDFRDERRLDRLRELPEEVLQGSRMDTVAETLGFGCGRALDAACRRIIGASFENWLAGRLA